MSTSVIEEIFDVFRRQAHLDYGESVTTVEHMLQCAVFAEADGVAHTHFRPVLEAGLRGSA